jgi:hypothetical protein
MKQIEAFLILLCLAFLNACSTTQPVANPQDERVGADGCIKPLATFAYSISTDPSKGIPNQKDFQIPPPWQLEAKLPSDASVILRTDRTIDHQIEVAAPDGALWAEYQWDARKLKETDTTLPILSKFNEQTEQFEFEQATQSIPAFIKGKAKDSNYWAKVLIDAQGMIWILVPKDAIYSYNPAAHEVKRQAEMAEIAGSPTLALDGSIYYVDNLFVEHGVRMITGEDIQIYHFMPTTGKIERVSTRFEPWPPFRHILVDHSGRLWADGLAWREPDQDGWYQLERSSIFITNVQWSGMEYRWETPEILMQSSDQHL